MIIKRGRRLSLFNFKTIFRNTENIHIKITFTHLDRLDTQKNSENFRFVKTAKTDARQKKSQKTGNQADQCCLLRSAKTGYGVQIMTSQDSQGDPRDPRGGRGPEIVETTSENS